MKVTVLKKIIKSKKTKLDFPDLEKTERHFIILLKVEFLITFLIVLLLNVIVFRMMQ